MGSVSRTKRFEGGTEVLGIADKIGGRRSGSAKMKRALEILRVWESSWGVYDGFVPAKIPPAPIMARTRMG